jgi:hypothetical protein
MTTVYEAIHAAADQIERHPFRKRDDAADPDIAV